MSLLLPGLISGYEVACRDFCKISGPVSTPTHSSIIDKYFLSINYFFADPRCISMYREQDCSYYGDFMTDKKANDKNEYL